MWLALGRSGVLPQKLVWDREAAIAGHGRPTSEFAAFCGQLKVGWVRRGARQDATDARSFPGHRPADGGRSPSAPSPRPQNASQHADSHPGAARRT